MLLRLHTFWYEYGAVSDLSILYHLFGISLADNQIWYKILSILLIFYQAVYINRLAAFNNLSSFNSLFPGVFYVLILSLIPDIHPMSSVLVGNTFVIMAIFHLLQTIHRNQRSKRLFSTGFFVCMALFLDMNFIYLVPFFIIASNAIILVRTRDVLLYVLGLLSPIYFLFAYWIFIDHFNEGIQQLSGYFHLFQYDFVFQNYGIIKAGILGLLVLFLLVVIGSVVTRTNIFVRNKLTFLIYLLIFSVIIFGLTFHTRLEDLQIIILPMGILMGLYFNNIKKVNMAESFHFLILILAVLFQYFLK